MNPDQMTQERVASLPVAVPGLNFTGERIVPGKTEEALFREHEERYVFAGQHVSGKDVLDVACGTGIGTSYLRRAGARDAWGLDIDPEAIKFAKARYRECNFAECDATQLSLPDNTVDVVVSFETLEHLEDHARFLRECWRVLRHGGLLICSTPNTTVYRWHGENPYHVHEFTIGEFVALVRKHFGNLHLFSQRGLLYPLYVVRRLTSRIPQASKLKRSIASLFGAKVSLQDMPQEFSDHSGELTRGIQPYRASWLIQPTYVIAVSRKISDQ